MKWCAPVFGFDPKAFTMVYESLQAENIIPSI